MNKTQITALSITGIAFALMGNSCMPTPGWEGTGTVVEIEQINPEREGNGIESDGLEVSVLLNNDMEDNAMFAPTQECADGIRIGQSLTLDQAVDICGEPDWSSDD